MNNASIAACLLLILLFSCDKESEGDNCLYSKQGDLITLADGAQARLAVLEDRRCLCTNNCFWEGYVGMTITLAGDTILKVDDMFGVIQDSLFLTQEFYITTRGDSIRLLNVYDPEDACIGDVAGEDLCLELEVR